MVESQGYPRKREFARRKMTARVGVLCQGRFSIETGVEIGEGGMLLQTNRHFNIGDQLEIKFSVPDGGYVSGQAVVLYMYESISRELHLGVRFIEPSIMLKYEVRQFVGGLKEEDR